MKTLTNTMILALLLAVPMMSNAQTSDNPIMGVTEFTLLPGHEMQFIEGVKLWKECYKENNGAETFNVWKRFQGEGVVYAVTGFSPNWADMDKEDAASKACRITAIRMIMPHVVKSEYNTTSPMPEYSRETLEGTKMVWVSFFRITNSTIFNEVAKEITNAIKSKEGMPRSYWYAFMGGGPEAPHYMISTPFTQFADLDVERDGPWKVYEAAQGKKKSDDLRAKWRSIVENSWSYLYTLNEELSN
ncbi:hypothetical protein U1E44_08560 [Arenibacter sp. GZD96]|uniref:hypothetical protein n=1 Tax=Aurantibrevibacter litoralis TaxID=3106030 RepID=UPI002AFDD9A1|nr:hypothetical protein [Arenibacter sp. GZD-96]MEA1786139.1 hypothetical protein [Arenibacter sp. GZD-96]